MTDWTRQLSIFNPDDFNEWVTLIGAGAIGSSTALMLCKLGLKNIIIYDFDKIEPHNLPNQLYFTNQVGKNKAEALKYVLEQFGEANVKTRGKFEKDSEIASRIVIVATDNMETRKIVFNASKKASIFIDARMGGQVYRLYTINPQNKEDCKFYEGTLYSDKEAVVEKCTERSIIWNIFGIAAEIGCQLTKVLNKQEYKRYIVRDYVNTVMEYE